MFKGNAQKEKATRMTQAFSLSSPRSHLRRCSAFATGARAGRSWCKKITDDVLAAIKSDKELAAGDKQKALKLAEEKVLPYIDFEHATRLAVGRAWRRRRPEQQQKLVERVPQHAGAHLLERASAPTRARR